MGSPNEEELRKSDRDGLTEHAHVLVVGSKQETQWEQTCSDLLDFGSLDATNMLVVSLETPPDGVLRRCCRNHNNAPAKISIIASNTIARSVPADVGGTVESSNVTITTISDPRDLTTIGIRVTEQLSAWEDDGNRPVVCFDSLNTLLDDQEPERVFKFLHVLSGRLNDSGALAHYHLDPETIDDQAADTMATIMDAIIEVETDGSWTVQS